MAYAPKSSNQTGGNVLNTSCQPKSKILMMSTPVEEDSLDSFGDDSIESEDLLVIETEENHNYLRKVVLGKLSRVSFRDALWHHKLGSYFVILSYLCTYDTLTTFSNHISEYGTFFILPYMLMMFVIGFPVLYLEMTLGQYTSSSAYVVFDRLAPAFVGIGVSALILNYLATINDQLLVSFFMSVFSKAMNPFTNEMPWHNCISGKTDASCQDYTRDCHRKDGLISSEVIPFVNGQYSYRSLGDTCIRSQLEAMYTSIQEIRAEQSYVDFIKRMPFVHYLLNEFSNLKFLTAYQWPSYEYYMYNAMAWGVVLFVMTRSRKFIVIFSGFSVLTTSLALSVMLVAFIVVYPPDLPYSNAFFEQSGFTTPGLWINAVLLTFRSLKLGQGGLIFLGSQNHFHNNLLTDCMVIITFMIFGPFLYALIHRLISDSFLMEVVEGDILQWKAARFSFFDIPIATLRHPVTAALILFSSLIIYPEFETFAVFLLSLMVLLSVLSSKVVRLEISVMSILENFDLFTESSSRVILLLVAVFSSALISFIFCYHHGYYLMSRLEDHIYPVASCFIILIELLVVCVFYGTRRLYSNATFMVNKYEEEQSKSLSMVINIIFMCLWSFFIPLFTSLAFAAFIYLENPISVADFCIIILILSPIPLAFFYRVTRKWLLERNIQPLFRVDPDLWGPRSKEDRYVAAKMEKRLRAKALW